MTASPDGETAGSSATRAAGAPDAPAARARRGRNQPHVRRDIEGLRALAVGLVVLDHAFGMPHGGFIGVDVFFVISGFLITGLLLKEHARTGRLSFADFYRRRARRILPLSTLVLAVVTAASFAVYLGTRAQQIAGDAFWSLLFSANWRFAANGTDYFAATRSPSPLQHYWSLAVEEQFYFVWPLLLLAVLTVLAGRQVRRRSTVLAVVAGLLLAATFVLALQDSVLRPTIAYFSTLTRAWELLAGAVLAIAAPAVARARGPWRTPVAWLGLAAIVVSAVVISPESTFPAPWAALPVLGTVAVIAAGTRERGQLVLLPLTNPLATYLGRISYSLYLWHWPVIVLLTALLPVDRLLHRGLAVLIGLGLSVLSFHLVEDPIRRSAWLEPRDRRARRTPTVHRVPRIAVAAGAVLVLGAAGTVMALDARYRAATAVPPGVVMSAPPPSAEELEDPATRVTAGLRAALVAQEWPELTPSPEAVLGAQPPQLNDPECVNDWDVVRQHCTYGDTAGASTAVLVGDSTAISWLPGLEGALGPLGWRIESYGKYGCPAPTVTVLAFSGERYLECDAHRDWTLDQLPELQPDLVILGSGEGYVGRLPSGATGADASAEWTQGLLETIRRAAVDGARVVVLSSPPSAKDLSECATRASRPVDCVSEIADVWHQTSAAEKAAVDQAVAQGLDVEYVDASGWVCADGLCPGFSDGLVIRSDINHLTWQYSSALAPVLREALVRDPAAG